MTIGLKLGDLPQELLLHILAFVGGEALIKQCSLVCRGWKESIDSSAELQLCAELWADGLISASNLGGSEALNTLYDRRRAWLGLNWAARNVLEIEPGLRAYDLVGGVFGRLDDHNFTALWLPSARDPTVRHSSGAIANFPQDFVMDPTQDLVAFVCQRNHSRMVEVDCRALSSLVPHPAAVSPVLTFPVGDYFLSFLKVDIAGDVISLFFDSSGRIVLLNWRRGVVLEGTDGNFPAFSPTSFILLSPRAYILGVHGTRPFLEIWTFDEVRHTRKATLQLPTMNTHRFSDLRSTVPRFAIHTSGYCANSHAGRPFHKSNHERILAIVFDIDAYVFVHCRYLLSYLGAPGGAEAVNVRWDDWGLQRTRILRMTHHLMRYIHGERVILASSQSPNTLQVLDFGMSASRRSFPGEPPAHDALCTTELHTEASTFVDTVAFVAGSITTALPYRKTIRSVDEGYSILILDEEQIIAVNEEQNELVVYAF